MEFIWRMPLGKVETYEGFLENHYLIFCFQKGRRGRGEQGKERWRGW